ncbi:MAG: peptidylprolyl isomerase [Planctomycetaceae bacterium]
MALLRTVQSVSLRQPLLWLLVACAGMCGCQGRTLKDDNPVFADAPPRRSLLNRSSVAETNEPLTETVIKSVSYSTDDGPRLTGNTVVAQVNGSPVFVDDLVGSMRLALESHPEIPVAERQKILQNGIRAKLDKYIEEEIVVQALNKAIPEDRQAQIAETMEGPFQEVIAKIKNDSGKTTDAELNELLANEGLSIDLLRETFIRSQKVLGYLTTIADPPGTAERFELVDYYKAHQQDFTTAERLRWQEIVVRFDTHGGREGAEKVMADVVRQLQQDADFADLATRHSDSLSAEKRGDMGWLERGGLADKAVEARLFELQSGQMTKVYVRDDRFELFRVVDHQPMKVSPFQEVQNEIQQKIRQQRQQAARKKAMEDLKAKATIVTMFDDDTTGKN